MEKIPAPIDNKNLLEDAFEDDVFLGFYWAPEHRTGKRRHLIGSVQTEFYDAMVDARWAWGDHKIDIRVIGTQPAEDIEEVRREVFDHYERTFKEWECEDNPALIVETSQVFGILTIRFYFEMEIHEEEAK